MENVFDERLNFAAALSSKERKYFKKEVTAMFKRLSAVLLAVLLLLSTAYAASIAVDFADTAALIDSEGTELIAPARIASSLPWMQMEHSFAAAAR